MIALVVTVPVSEYKAEVWWHLGFCKIVYCFIDYMKQTYIWQKKVSGTEN